MSQDKTFDLTYAHCTRYTAGQPDRDPFSSYEFRVVRAKMFRVAPDRLLGETEDSFELERDGQVIGWGDTKQDAIHDARYRLMDRSRTEAEEISRKTLQCC